MRKDVDANGHEKAVYMQRALCCPVLGYRRAMKSIHSPLFGTMPRNVRDANDVQWLATRVRPRSKRSMPDGPAVAAVVWINLQ
jgi:hypothetical protein